MTGAESEVIETNWVRLRRRGPLFSDNLIEWLARAIMWMLRSPNPRPEVWLSRHPLHPGAEFSMGWAFGWGLLPLRAVRITLEGAELALISDAEGVLTYRKVFSTGFLVDEAYRRTGGRCRGSVPAGIMPTLHGKGDRIEWTIHVMASPAIPWPGPDHHFVVEVFPAIDTEAPA